MGLITLCCRSFLFKTMSYIYMDTYTNTPKHYTHRTGHDFLKINRIPLDNIKINNMTPQY